MVIRVSETVVATHEKHRCLTEVIVVHSKVRGTEAVPQPRGVGPTIDAGNERGSSWAVEARRPEELSRAEEQAAGIAPREHHGGCAAARGVRDVEALVADARVTAVSIVLPHFLHARVTLAALAADKHVFLEKPVAHSIASARRILTAARNAAGKLYVAGPQTHTLF